MSHPKKKRILWYREVDRDKRDVVDVCLAFKIYRKTYDDLLKMKMLVKRELGLDVSTTIIYRYYKRRKLIRKPQRKLSWLAPMKHHLTVKSPGECLQIDVKYVYESGERKFQFSVFNPFTLKYHFTIFPSKESRNTIDAFLNAEKYF